ncbi:MAG: beta-ketoacyl-[acyl-carrier-protein] synthase family protein [Paludibacteraceae bacterium]|nr:beta-ketoacyl-[acyl-carrier-protein] synthase family protein [Paludibacteraceae bacterium]
MRRRVVVTGIGIWSSIGQNLQTVSESLKQGRSGIVFDSERIDYGMRTALIGNVPLADLKPLLPHSQRATMTEDACYAYMAARQAFEQARMDDAFLRTNEVGVIFGNDGNSSGTEVSPVMRKEKDSEMVGPYLLFADHTSSPVFHLSSLFHLRGVSYSVDAACSSSSHAIGIASVLIRNGIQSTILVGGSMEVHRLPFFAEMDVADMLSRRNEEPEKASRPFDQDRDGMVPSGGAAALVLEEYEHAVARGATILAEVAGYGFSSNGIEEISMPSADAEFIAMKRAIADAGLQPSDVDYVNAHATSTLAGDIEEAKALTRLFVEENQIINHQSAIINRKPYVSSTKSMTGHENWMAGASEAVYSILMMQNNFVAPNINLENVIDEAKDLNIVRKTVYTPVRTVLSNSSGMGGTNSALVFRKI